MKSKILYVIFTMAALLCLFSVSAFAGFDLDSDQILELDKVDNLYECVSGGDANNDGVISADDARYILRLSVNLEKIDASAFMKTDVDGDGKITAQDARLALRLAVGLDKLPKHNIEEIVIVPATCATEGLTVKVCTVCIKIYATVTVPASTDKHIPSPWKTTQTADCSHTGKAEIVCLSCGEKLKEVEIPATREHSGEWIYPDGKSCLDPVAKNRTCTVCGLYEEKIENPPGGHSFKWFVEKKNTCTEDGYEIYKCSHCGLVSRGIITEAHGHLFEQNVVIKKATCTEFGIIGEQCVYCEATRNEGATNALGHKFDNQHYKVTKEPDCAQTGTADVVCTVCGESDEIILPTTEHTLTEGWTQTAAADCTNNGEMAGVCRYCGPVTKVIPAKGHTVTKWVNVTPATCASPGLQQGECSVCGDKSATKEIPVKAHVFDTSVQYWTSGVLCKENGEGYYKCKNCDAQQKIILLQRPCNNKNGKAVREVNEATCTKAKTVVDVCDFCAQDIPGTEVTTGKPLGHDFDETTWTETKPASCTANGERTCECTRCDDVKKEVIPAYGHTPGEWQETKTPSCSEEGENSLMCSECGGVIRTEAIEKSAHTEKKTIITDSESVNEEGHLMVKCLVECEVCHEVLSEEEPVTRVAVDAQSPLSIVFDAASDLAPGGEVRFTIDNAATEMFVMITWGVDGFEILEAQDGEYSFTIPETISDTETVTVVAVIISA